MDSRNFSGTELVGGYLVACKQLTTNSLIMVARDMALQRRTDRCESSAAVRRKVRRRVRCWRTRIDIIGAEDGNWSLTDMLNCDLDAPLYMEDSTNVCSVELKEVERPEKTTNIS